MDRTTTSICPTCGRTMTLWMDGSGEYCGACLLVAAESTTVIGEDYTWTPPRRGSGAQTLRQQAVAKRYGATPRPVLGATDKQRSYLRSLLDTRQHDHGDTDAFMDELDENHDRRAVSRLIDALKDAPRRQAPVADDRLMGTPAQLDAQAADEARFYAQGVPDGTYTVILDGDSDYVTLRLRDASSWADAGTQKIEYLAGPDNGTDYVAFGFVKAGRLIVWKRYRDGYARQQQAAQVLLGADADQRAEAGLAYAMASSRCCRCNRKLTVPASLHRGMGPECASR